MKKQQKKDMIFYGGIVMFFMLISLFLTVHYFDYTDLTNGAFWFGLRVNAFIYDFVFYLAIFLILILIIFWVKNG